MVGTKIVSNKAFKSVQERDTLLKVLLLTIRLNCNAKVDSKSTKNGLQQSSVAETFLPAKGISEGYGIFFTASRHRR